MAVHTHADGLVFEPRRLHAHRRRSPSGAASRDRLRVRLDDVVIPTAGSLDDHLRDVGLVCDKLIEAGLAVRCDKFHLAFREAPYLGFLCGSGGHRPQPDKVKALLDMTCEDMADDPSAAARYSGMIQYFIGSFQIFRMSWLPFTSSSQRALMHVASCAPSASSPPSLTPNIS